MLSDSEVSLLDEKLGGNDSNCSKILMKVASVLCLVLTALACCVRHESQMLAGTPTGTVPLLEPLRSAGGEAAVTGATEAATSAAIAAAPADQRANNFTGRLKQQQSRLQHKIEPHATASEVTEEEQVGQQRAVDAVEAQLGATNTNAEMDAAEKAQQATVIAEVAEATEAEEAEARKAVAAAKTKMDTTEKAKQAAVTAEVAEAAEAEEAEARKAVAAAKAEVGLREIALQDKEGRGREVAETIALETAALEVETEGAESKAAAVRAQQELANLAFGTEMKHNNVAETVATGAAEAELTTANRSVRQGPEQEAMTGALMWCSKDCAARSHRAVVDSAWVSVFVAFFVHSGVISTFEDEGHFPDSPVGGCTATSVTVDGMTADGSAYLLYVSCETEGEYLFSSRDKGAIERWRGVMKRGLAVKDHNAAREEVERIFPNICLGVQPEGQPLTNTSQVMDADACQLICQQNPNCFAFVFNRVLCKHFEDISAIHQAEPEFYQGLEINRKDAQAGIYKSRASQTSGHHVACPAGTQLMGGKEVPASATRNKLMRALVILFMEGMFPEVSSAGSVAHAYDDCHKKRKAGGNPGANIIALFSSLVILADGGKVTTQVHGHREL